MAQAGAQRLHRVGATTMPQHHPKPHTNHPHTQGFGPARLVFDSSAQVRLELARAGWGGFVQGLHRCVGRCAVEAHGRRADQHARYPVQAPHQVDYGHGGIDAAGQQLASARLGPRHAQHAGACQVTTASMVVMEQRARRQISASHPLWQLRNHFDLELKAIQPRHPNARERGVRRIAPVFADHSPGCLHVFFGIHHEHRHIDHVVKRAASGPQDGVEVVERQTHLGLVVGLRRAIGTAAHLARDEEETVGADGGRVAVLFVERLAPGWKDHVARGCVRRCHGSVFLSVGRRGLGLLLKGIYRRTPGR